MNILNLKLLILSAAIILLQACGGDDDPETDENENPGSFSASVTNITKTSATINWTDAVDPDGDNVTYTVVLDGNTLVSGTADNSFTANSLESDVNYSGTITASDGNGGQSSATFSFSTNGNQNPDMFTVSVSNITMTTASLAWTEAIDDDGDNITYAIKLDGTEVGSGLTTASYDLTDLTAGTTYSGTVEASDGNGGMSSASFGFTTEQETTYEVSISGMTTASEGDPGTGFKIVLDKANQTGSGISVSYDLSGTATAGSDYQAPSGTATIADGDTEVTVEIPFMDDADEEGDETLTITLSDQGLASNISLSSTFSLSITITDNDTGVACSNDNSIDQDNHVCDETPVANQYDDNTINIAGNREVVTNGIPTHNYRNQIPEIVPDLDNSTKTYEFDDTPEKAGTTTSVNGIDGRPQWKFGVAKNGVAIDPAPAEPFIFENPETGEYNWDWVMEPNNNMDAVGLDCAIAHVQPDGLYHYHGNMAIYAEQLSTGISTGTPPTNPVQIGWAADGFPILYLYGPTADGSGIEKLTSSYQLKAGERPGDGTTEPCGEYNGKYTNDYEYVNASGDLDECNGIDRNITLSTGTYSYFYVITEEFPIISRCLVGTPHDSFKIGP